MLEKKVSCTREDPTDETPPEAKRKPARSQHRRQETRHGHKAEKIAWLYQDSGSYRDAQYWLGRALDWSHISADAGTVAFILARKSQLAGQMHDAAEANDVAEAGIRHDHPRSRSAVVTVTYAAHGHALQGEKTACLRMYDYAREQLDTVDDDPDIWYGRFLDKSYIEIQRAHSLSLLGDYEPAAGAFQNALNNLPVSYYRDRGVYLARKALAHVGAAGTSGNAT